MGFHVFVDTFLSLLAGRILCWQHATDRLSLLFGLSLHVRPYSLMPRGTLALDFLISFLQTPTSDKDLLFGLRMTPLWLTFFLCFSLVSAVRDASNATALAQRGEPCDCGKNGLRYNNCCAAGLICSLAVQLVLLNEIG